MLSIEITKNEEGQRIDKFIRKYLDSAPLSFIYKLFRKKSIKVNRKKVEISYILKSGDVIDIYINSEQLENFHNINIIKPYRNNLEVLFEDDNIIVVNKENGILVQRNSNETTSNLSNLVLSYLSSKTSYSDGDFIPSPAHRIDRNTSGIVIFGKSVRALQELLELFKSHDNVEKIYLALVVGHPPKSQLIQSFLSKDEEKNEVKVVKSSKQGKLAITEFRVLEYFEEVSLVEVKIFTGRTHQIRVQMANIGYPVVGDNKYGNFAFNREFERKYNWKNQFLHSYKFRIVTSKNVLKYLENFTISAPISNKMEEIIHKLAKKL